jgi:hypothetical protein
MCSSNLEQFHQFRNFVETNDHFYLEFFYFVWNFLNYEQNVLKVIIRFQDANISTISSFRPMKLMMTIV